MSVTKASATVEESLSESTPVVVTDDKKLPVLEQNDNKKRRENNIGVGPVIGVKGVPLKHFERVVASLLEHQSPAIEPTFVPLPRFACGVGDHSNNYNDLPAAARVYGTLAGQISNYKRAQRKEQQLKCMTQCIYALLPPDEVIQQHDNGHNNNNNNNIGITSHDKPITTIVEFGGGSGHLAIPLALRLPNVRVIVVELSEKSIQLLHDKAKACCGTDNGTAGSNSNTTGSHGTKQTIEDEERHLTSRLRQVPTIDNLYIFHGPLEEYARLVGNGDNEYHFDIGVALHLCGEATDVALRLCGHIGATCVFCPCCVGKLNDTRRNPYIWQATGTNTPTVHYPQSKLFQSILGDGNDNNTNKKSKDDWNALAKAADYSDVGEYRTPRNATRRTAKALLEMDRVYFLKETFNYDHVLLSRMEPWDISPKNDLLLAWNDSNNATKTQRTCSLISFEQNVDCVADIQLARKHLFHAPQPAITNGKASAEDWDQKEELVIQKTLQDFFFADTTARSCEQHPQVYIFPTGMGRRKRKLIHYVAEQFKLAHWCVGEKESEKTVAVAQRGTRQNRDEDAKES